MARTNNSTSKVAIIIHTNEQGMTRMIPQVFASRQVALASLQMTAPEAMKLKEQEKWMLPRTGSIIEIREFEVLSKPEGLK